MELTQLIDEQIRNQLTERLQRLKLECTCESKVVRPQQTLITANKSDPFICYIHTIADGMDRITYIDDSFESRGDLRARTFECRRMQREEISVVIVIRCGMNDDLNVCVRYCVREKDADSENECEDVHSCRQVVGAKSLPIGRRRIRWKEIQVDYVLCHAMY